MPQESAGAERFCLRENVAVPAAEERHPEFAGTFFISFFFFATVLFIRPTEGLTYKR